MKKSSILLVAILLSCTFLLAVPSASAASYEVVELWSNPMAVNDVAVSADGNYIAAVNNTGVYFFSRNSSQPRWWYTDEGGYFGSVAISANGDYVAAGFTRSGSGFLYYFNESTTTFNGRGYTWRSVEFPGAIDNPRLVAISDDGNFVVAGANNGTGNYMHMKYFNGSTARFGSSEAEMWNAWSVDAPISSLDISADGNYVAAGGPVLPAAGWVFFVGDASTNPQPWGNSKLLPIIDVAVSDDGYAVAAVSDSPTPDTIYYWKDPGNIPNDSPANWTNLLAYGCVDISSDGDVVVAGTPAFSECGIHLWDGARTRTGTNEPETWNRFAGQQIPDIAISRDGLIVAATAVNYTDGSLYWTYFLDSSGGLIGQFAIDAPGMTISTSISGNTTAVAAGILATLYVYVLTQVGPGPTVGGEILGLDGLGLLAPYLMMALLVAGTTVILLKRRRP